MAKTKTNKNSSVLTIRINEELDQVITEICEKKDITRAKLIRNYLEMTKYILIDTNSLKSLNENDLILLKKNLFYDILEKLDELTQIDIGTEIAQFINDLARIENKLNDVEYKLNLCEHLGLFSKFIDKGNYILISKRFGPKKFVESFIWHLITIGDKGDFDKGFVESEMENNKKLKSKYNNTIQPVDRDSSHYAFEFAKIEKVEEEQKRAEP